jgi:hypothetical protein
MNVGGEPPASLGQAGINLLHSLPRYGGGSNTLGVVDPGNAETFEENKKYAIGVALPFGIALLLALVTWSACGGFCCARSCCNSCGGRTASRAYTSKDQLWLKIGIIILAAAFIVLFFIGVVSNAAVSSSIDKAYLKSDALVEHLFQFNAPIKTMSDVATDALRQVQSLNSDVLTQLPDAAAVASYIDCSTTMYDTIQAELVLLTQIAPITGSALPSTGGSTGPVLNLTGLAQQLIDILSEPDHVQSHFVRTTAFAPPLGRPHSGQEYAGRTELVSFGGAVYIGRHNE